LFNIGDKIFYPGQGIGIIDIIEEKELNGEKQKYYIIQLFNNTLKLTLPFSRVDPSNIRLISDSITLDNSLKHINKFVADPGELAKINFKERRTINELKLKTGTLENYLEVISTLTQLKFEHNLNSSEKQMLNKVKSIVIEEILQSKNLSNDEATSLLEGSMVFEN
jgi:CarD family transcriptional regulator